MVLLLAPVLFWIGIGLIDGLKYLIANNTQDAPGLQLFIAFCWGLGWPLRLMTSSKTNGVSNVE